MNEIIKLAVDLARGSTGEFSVEDTNETLRQHLISIVGSENPTHYQLEKHKHELFEIISVAIDSVVTEGITNQFDFLAEVRNMNWGDLPVFDVEDPSLFKVATISNGNGELRRQRITNGKVAVATEMKGIKIYDELKRYLAGRINWPKMVEKVALSFQQNVKTDGYQAIYDSYDKLTAPYKISGVFDEAKLAKLCADVEAANNGAKVIIVGTKLALSKITSATESDKMKDNLNELGFYGVFKGWDMLAVQQTHKPGTKTFAIDDSFLLVIPVPSDKMLKIVFEGEAIIMEDQMQGSNPADLSKNYLFMKAYGVAVIASADYGIYRIGE